MTEQEHFEKHVIGKTLTITGCEWLETYDDGSPVDDGRPLLLKLNFSNGDAISFDGFCEAYYEKNRN